MDAAIIITGIILGFSIAAPVGPIGVLCIRRTLADGRVVGLVSGLGAASADAMYGAIAAFGLTFISTFLTGQGVWLKLIGGLFLVYLGVRTLLSRPASEAAKIGGVGLLGVYASTFALTVTNPATIISFIALFSNVGIAAGAEYDRAALLVLGVFCGSALWWLLLSGGVSLLRSRVDNHILLWVNRISGACITLFGLAVLASLLG